MTDYEKCRCIRDYICRKATECFIYGWSESYIAEVINEIPIIINKCYKGKVEDYISPIDITNLSKKELLELGFKIWDEYNKYDIALIPIWLVKFINTNTSVISINNKRGLLGDFIKNDDNRMGVMAYGIELKKEN